MRVRKFAYLFLALLVPGLIFVFLKFAGTNRFDVPVYPVDGNPLHSDCVGDVAGPYFIPDSLWRRVPNKTSLVVVMFSSGDFDEESLSRSVVGEVGPRVTFINGDRLSPDPARWRGCVFLLQAPRQSTLIDSLGQIRGQYDLRNLDEIDRLRVEVKILLGSY